MNRSARKQHHEQARKKHRHDQQEHAREAARQQPSMRAAWVLGIGIVLVLAIVVGVTLF